MALEKTCIIVTNLDKQDFVAAPALPMLVADTIKFKVAQCCPQVEYWLCLPNLARIIVILTSEADATRAAETIREWAADKRPQLRVLLQENLLLRSKLLDAVLESPEMKFRSQFTEPSPQAFDVVADLKNIGIDVSDYNTTSEMAEWQNPPTMGVGRSRSQTRTLFRPRLDTSDATLKTRGVSPPTSPTITLDDFAV